MEKQPIDKNEKQPFDPIEEGLDLSDPKDWELLGLSQGDLTLLDLERQRLKLRELVDKGDISSDRFEIERSDVDLQIITRQVELGLIDPQQFAPLVEPPEASPPDMPRP